MNNNEFEKSKNELEKKIEQNNKEITIYDERVRMSKVNSFENKAFTTLGLSSFGYFAIFLASLSLIKNIGVSAFTNIIPALSFPAILLGSSFGIGALINSLINKKYKTKERYKEFSNAKTEKDKLAEQIYYQIELEKANNRNKVLNETIKILDSNQVMLNKISKRYELNDKILPKTKEEAEIKANEISNIIKEQYDKLDILSIQKVLHDNFWRVRSKEQNSTYIITAIAIGGVLTGLFTLAPLILLNETITYGSLFASIATTFTPFIVGGLGVSGYMIKRNKDYKKVFNNINSLLGENALEQKYKNFDGAYEEEQEIETLIENQIRDISLAEVQLQENRRHLDTFITEEDKKKENLFKDVQQLNIIEEMENEVINASLPVEEKKSHRLVRKKTSS